MTRPKRPTPTPSSALGATGEARAARALRAAGLKIVARNLRTRFGEIDILARRRTLWIAVEVKTRRGRTAPERTVTPEQLARIEQSLRALAPSLRPRPRSLRVDLVGISIHPDGTADAAWFPGDEFAP